MKLGFACYLLAAVALASNAEQRACRSVHLWYTGPEAIAFYNEVTVEKSAPGTYFMACGFGGGYFGIQELGNGKKVVLFSVWEPDIGNNPATKIDAGVEDGRFFLRTGGETRNEHVAVKQTFDRLLAGIPPLPPTGNE